MTSAPDTQWSGDAPTSLAAIGSAAALMASVLLLAPAIAGQLIVDVGLTPPQAGRLISAELAGISLASIPAFWLLKWFNWRWVYVIALIWVGVGNAASMFVDDYAPLVWLRFATALAAGHVMVITMRMAGAAANAERSYAVWLIGQLLVGAVGLAVLPPLFEQYGLALFYGGYAVLALALTLAAVWIPRRLVGERRDREGSGGPPVAGWICLLGVLLFYVGIGGVWTFVEQMGVAAGHDRQTIGVVLGIATVAGIVGVVAAPLLAPVMRRDVGVLAGGVLLVGSVLALHAASPLLGFAIAGIAFKFAWTFTLPFALAAIAVLDRDGLLVLLTNVLIGGGLALGPFAATFLIFQGEEYSRLLNVMAGVSLAASLALAYGAARSIKARSRASQPT